MRLPALLHRTTPPRPRRPGTEPVAPPPPHLPPSSSGRFARPLRWFDTHRKLVAVVAALLLFVGIGAGAGGDAGWLRGGAGADGSGGSTADPAAGRAEPDGDKALSGGRPSSTDNADKKAADQAGRGSGDKAGRGSGSGRAGQGSATAGSAADRVLAGESAADQAAARRAAEDRAAAQKLAAAQAADDRAAAERAARATGTTRPIAMPNLVGRKLNEAVSTAADAGLTGVTVCRTQDGDTPLWWSNWRVTAQTVPTGTRIRPDHAVCLTAAKP